jgi:hypothetical protein
MFGTALPARAAPSGETFTSTATALLKIAGGTCPRRVQVATRTRRYEGGAEFTITVASQTFVMPPIAVKRSHDRLAFSAALAPAFRTCVATARLAESGSTYAFDWRDGSWRLTMRPSPELQVMRVRTAGGNPTIVAAVAD